MAGARADPTHTTGLGRPPGCLTPRRHGRSCIAKWIPGRDSGRRRRPRAAGAHLHLLEAFPALVLLQLRLLRPPAAGRWEPAHDLWQPCPVYGAGRANVTLCDPSTHQCKHGRVARSTNGIALPKARRLNRPKEGGKAAVEACSYRCREGRGHSRGCARTLAAPCVRRTRCRRPPPRAPPRPQT